jgi:outer membrane protein assembly factor BamB
MSWREALNPPQPWAYRPREYSTPHYRELSDEMYVGTDGGTLFKIRGGDGKALWSKQLQGPIHAEPVYGDGRVYVGTLEGHFYAIDASTGDVVWSSETGATIESRAAFAEGRIFFTTSDDVLLAADAATGKRLWNYRRTAPEYFTIKETAKPIVDEGVVYCGFADGVMVALQIDTGEMLWNSDLSAGKTEFIDADEDPIAAGSRLFAASYDGGLYAIDKTSGEHIWRQPLSGIADFVYGGDSLYVGTANGRLVAVDAEDGSVQWGFRFKDHTPVAITATQLYLFVSTSSGPVYVVDRNSGRPLITWNPSTGFNTRVVFGSAAGFAISNRGYLYGFDVAY